MRHKRQQRRQLRRPWRPRNPHKRLYTQPRRPWKLRKKWYRLPQAQSALLPVHRKGHGRRRERAAAPRSAPPLLHDLARPLENPRQKNRFARPHRRGERPQQKAAGVRPQKSAGFRPQNPEEVHGGAAEETARALSSYRLLTAGLIGRARSQKIVSFVSVKVACLDSF